MKKLFCFLLMVLTTINMAGCIYLGDPPGETTSPEPTTKPTSQATITPGNTTTPTATPEQTTLPSSAPPATVTPATTLPSAAPVSGDIANAVNGETSTKEKAIPLGQWARLTKYVPKDESYHPIYGRINKITTASADAKYVDDAIALHNSVASEYSQVDVSKLNLPADVELCIVDYEVYVPDTYPTEVYGILPPELDLWPDEISDIGFPSADGKSAYLTMDIASTLESQKDATYAAGNTYSFKAYYPMVKGYTDYILDSYFYTEGKADAGETLHAYFAVK